MTGPDTFEYELKGREQYSQENDKNELPRKKYFPQTLLKDIIMEFNNGKPVLTKDEQEKRKAYGSFYLSREEEEQKKGIYLAFFPTDAHLIRYVLILM